jgi:hypothetical protein
VRLTRACVRPRPSLPTRKVLAGLAWVNCSTPARPPRQERDKRALAFRATIPALAIGFPPFLSPDRVPVWKLTSKARNSFNFLSLAKAYRPPSSQLARVCGTKALSTGTREVFIPTAPLSDFNRLLDRVTPLTEPRAEDVKALPVSDQAESLRSAKAATRFRFHHALAHASRGIACRHCKRRIICTSPSFLVAGKAQPISPVKCLSQ